MKKFLDEWWGVILAASVLVYGATTIVKAQVVKPETVRQCYEVDLQMKGVPGGHYGTSNTVRVNGVICEKAR